MYKASWDDQEIELLLAIVRCVRHTVMHLAHTFSFMFRPTRVTSENISTSEISMYTVLYYSAQIATRALKYSKVVGGGVPLPQGRLWAPSVCSS